MEPKPSEQYEVEKQLQEVIDEGDLKKYRTEIPNLIDDMGLDPYQHRLYVHYKRVCGASDGVCYETVRTTASKCGMSAPQVCGKRDELAEKGLIAIAAKQGVRDSRNITIVDIWATNFAYYILLAKRRPDIKGLTIAQIKIALSGRPRVCSCGEQPCSCGEHFVHVVESKKEPIKKEPIKNIGAAQKTAAPPAPLESEPEIITFKDPLPRDPPHSADDARQRVGDAIDAYNGNAPAEPWRAWQAGSPFWQGQREAIRRVGYLVEKRTGLSPPNGLTDKKKLRGWASGYDGLLVEAEGDFALLDAALAEGMSKLADGKGLTLSDAFSVAFMVSDYRAQKRRSDDKPKQEYKRAKREDYPALVGGGSGANASADGAQGGKGTPGPPARA